LTREEDKIFVKELLGVGRGVRVSWYESSYLQSMSLGTNNTCLDTTNWMPNFKVKIKAKYKV